MSDIDVSIRKDDIEVNTRAYNINTNARAYNISVEVISELVSGGIGWMTIGTTNIVG